MATTKADDIVEFLSVQTHANFTDALWSSTAWRAKLGDMKVRHTRGGFGTTKARGDLTALYNLYGIRATATFNAINSDCTFDLVQTDMIIAALKNHGVPKYTGIEGPNEYTANCKTGNWGQRMRDYQLYLWNKIQNDGALAPYWDVISGSIFRRVVADYITAADQTNTCDYANLHLYTDCRKPSKFNGATGDDPVSQAMTDAQLMANKPVSITETGYLVNLAGEQLCAKYALRLIGEIYKLKKMGLAGRRMNYYSLLDDPGEAPVKYGLLNQDFSERLAYWSIRNWQTILGEATWNGTTWTYPSFTTSKLNFSFTNVPADVKYLIAQKSDGRYYFITWNDAVSFDRVTDTEVNVPRVSATLKVNTPFSLMRLYEPTVLVGESPNTKLNYLSTSSTPNVQMTLSIPDHVQILEFVP